MILVVLRAGASYDSVAAHPAPPSLEAEYPRLPLADQLFALRDEFRKASAIYAEVQTVLPRLPPRASGSNVEEVLAALASEVERLPERKKQLLALRFYITRVIRDSENKWCDRNHGELNHATLFDLLDLYRGTEEVCVVTFNYDTLVERTLPKRLGPRPDFGALTDGRNGYRLFKLHGSITWNRILAPGIQEGRDPHDLLARYAQIQITDKFRMVESQRPEAVFIDGLHFIPAIAVPVANKAEFECPAGHVEVLNELLPSTSRLIVIGWRAGEEHFLNLLKNRVKESTPMLILNGREEDGKATRDRLVRIGLQGETPSMSFGFTTGLVSGYLKRWLSDEIH